MKKFGFIGTLASMLLVVGCGSATSTSTTQDNSSTAANSGHNVTKITVGTGTQFPNVCFIDNNGKLTGFDVELVREIDKRLPDYEFQFKTMDFSNLLLSLQTNKIDFVAHQMEKNSDRESKFLFNKEPYNVFPTKVVVNEKNNTIHSIDDLKGKNVIVGATSNEAYIVEQYNRSHNNAIHIIYSGNGGTNDTINQLKSGRADATISTQFAVDFENKVADAQEKTVGPTITNSKVYFIFRKDETKLANEVDQALKEIKADGTLAKLSVKWLGRDYSQETNE